MNLEKMLKEYESLVNSRMTLLLEENEKLRTEIEKLKARNEKLSKRHPTTEEALAQYHWLKENSKRNK